MKLTTHTTATDFLSHAQAALDREEVANNLMLGIALRLQAAPETAQTPPYLATVADAGQLVFAALMTPPYPLTLFSPASDIQVIDQAFSLIAADLRANAQPLRTNAWPLPAISGRAPLAAQCAEVWRRQTGGRCQVRMHERIYELRRVIPLLQSPPGRSCVAGAAHSDLVAQWAYEFMLEALPNETPQYAGDDARRRIPKGDVFLWEDGGQPVSMAFSMRRLATAVSVGMVYTPPALRGHGYASACVAALSQHLLDSGRQRCVLFTDLANPTSNSIYQRIGYAPVCDYDEIGLIPPSETRQG